jgi:hypothetical protein
MSQRWTLEHDILDAAVQECVVHDHQAALQRKSLHHCAPMSLQQFLQLFRREFQVSGLGGGKGEPGQPLTLERGQ